MKGEDDYDNGLIEHGTTVWARIRALGRHQLQIGYVNGFVGVNGEIKRFDNVGFCVGVMVSLSSRSESFEVALEDIEAYERPHE